MLTLKTLLVYKQKECINRLIRKDHLPKTPNIILKFSHNILRENNIISTFPTN